MRMHIIISFVDLKGLSHEMDLGFEDLHGQFYD